MFKKESFQRIARKKKNILLFLYAVQVLKIRKITMYKKLTNTSKSCLKVPFKIFDI